MESFSDPESLRGRASVPFREESRSLTRDEFQSVAESADSHAVLGITNDEGEVLLMNDGSHGWTLVAFPVDPGADWTAVARREAERLLDVTVDLEQVELVRRIDFHLASDESQERTMYDVIFRASVDGNVAVDASDRTEDDPSLRWFERVPDEQQGPVADDVRRFLE